MRVLARLGARGRPAGHGSTTRRTRRATSTPTRPGTPRSPRCCRRGRRWRTVASIAAADRDRLRTAVEVGEPGFQSSVDGVGWDRIVLVTAPRPAWRDCTWPRSRRTSGCDAVRGDGRAARRPTRRSAASGTRCARKTCARSWATRRVRRVRRVGDRPRRPGRRPAGAPARLRHVPPRAGDGARRGLLPLEAVIRKMTSLPADRFGLRDRGTIAAGAFADLVAVRSRDGPRHRDLRRAARVPRRALGVVVNGTLAWEPGATSIDASGRALRR